MKRTIAVTLAAAVLIGCGETAAERTVDAQQLAEDVAGAPTQEQVQQGLAAGNVDTGGTVSATIDGNAVEMTDVTFCVTETGGMSVFALAANNAQWSISLGLVGAAPAPGRYGVVITEANAMAVGLVDKRSGSTPAEWQQYDAGSGHVEVTASDRQRVTGSYEFTATPTYPQTSGATVTVRGTFDAPPATRC